MEPTPDHPYSMAKRAGDFIFVSGALSVDENYQPVEGRKEALDAALARMTERLATAGGELKDLVKLTYFVTDITLREDANEQFAEHFAKARPARTFLEASRLPYGASVEIDAIAYVGD
ncbi:MAG: RidA family protein [Corynebacterium sp.]|uniref:RidA family protein n=1 Tax=Corynebacterium sp. TaxID=1720 RepID=UPI0026DF2587|nr:RidA family protein [Corynebacterium sp.]MDO5669411.1 RidA family protein [Corynebacterium sp.]